MAASSSRRHAGQGDPLLGRPVSEPAFASDYYFSLGDAHVVDDALASQRIRDRMLLWVAHVRLDAYRNAD